VFIVVIYVEKPSPESIELPDESVVVILILSVGLNVLGFLIPESLIINVVDAGCSIALAARLRFMVMSRLLEEQDFTTKFDPSKYSQLSEAVTILKSLGS
jgi:hypothetical protein